DEVVLNTTAVELDLGTGGYHFVIYNLNNGEQDAGKEGHIMKLRYTPFQIKTFAAEEQDSPYHDVFHRFKSLNKMPVIVGTLHSMLIPIASILKYLNNDLKIAFIMTDGAALPLYLSNNVYELKNKGIIHKTITLGHAFGGDYEVINIYNALIAAKEITKCGIAVVTMGPGIVGTGTPYGFTGIEQGYIADAVNDLGGIPILVPRITFKDKRERHYGISHHSMTVLGKIMKTRSNIALPKFSIQQEKIIQKQLKENGLIHKHNIFRVETDILKDALEHYKLEVRTMGRSPADDPEFFNTCSASAIYADSLL
ncbi:MAG TPA: DUF3866 family protein, partial [Oscillospiraceae bacterium]|nr:DUF3866 family protein [Oscillospiraceae bacterium]